MSTVASRKRPWTLEMEDLKDEMQHLDLVRTQPTFYGTPIKKPLQTHTSNRCLRSRPEAILPERTTPKKGQKRPNPNSEEEIKKIYLNKKIKVIHKNLETIYEVPVSKKGHTSYLGSSKVKRSIHLTREFRIKSKQKSKIRSLKIKGLGKREKKLKLTDDEFQRRMLLVDEFINED